MRNRLVLWGGIVGGVLVILLFLILKMNGPASVLDVTPQYATPLPSPTNNGGKATWTLNNMTFQSNYPKGFAFSLDAASSGGKIILATVRWKHSLGLSAQARGRIDPSGKFIASWIPTVTSSIPQWVGVEYWWTLQDEAGNSYETPHQHEEYADNTRKWNRGESDDVIVFVQDGLPDTIMPTIIKAVHDNRARYYQLWGKLLNYRPRVIVYADYSPWLEWKPGADVVAGGRFFYSGWTDPAWGGTVQVFTKNYGERVLPGWDPVQMLAYGLVLHEFGHLYQIANGIQPTVGWFDEGDAEFNANYPIHLQGIAARISARIRAGNVPSLQGEGPTIIGQDAIDGYDFGFKFWQWIQETYGPDAHLKIWKLAGQGKAVADSIQSVTGMNMTDTDTAFRKWLGMENPVAPPPMEFPTMQFPPTPDYSKPTATP